ncbi:GNAT family N-acetyltransferase [Saccharibacillus kuerlensis]|uniref:50S ribosomal protein L7 serine acetyltransferase n=1 Tax=Saccharibacillus kuerlensis TaxID=459527 RepID=A0ABQ2KUV8_9BACL|nr:GNAT family protein [Saccharibacillus kuerlensis]GGN93487.1 50S ribosomal protein L7 serine acetyltransferase [Saccharibacillus kuerlensis]
MFSLPLKESVVLKPLRSGQARELLELIEDSRHTLRPWMPWTEQIRSISDAEEFIASSIRLYADNDAITAALWEHDRLAGVIGFHEINWRSRSVQIGYWLGSSFEGRGLMSLAVRAFVDYAFIEMDLNRIEIRCATSNRRSRALPERLGFLLEGVLRQAEKLETGYVDHAVYGLLAEEWSIKRPLL